MNLIVKVLLSGILIFSSYHLIRDVLQIFNIDNSFTQIAHRDHEWCKPICDYVTIPFDMAGIVVPAILLRRNRFGRLGVILICMLIVWTTFVLLK